MNDILEKVEYSIEPLSENLVVVRLGNQLDIGINAKVHALIQMIKQENLPGIQAYVPAYASLALQYDPEIWRRDQDYPFENIRKRLWEILKNFPDLAAVIKPVPKIEIPVCYGGEFGPDLEWVANYLGMSQEEVVHMHTQTIFHVFMLGFSPGFPLMGVLPEKMSVPRKDAPRMMVAEGSVGLAGLQTGIYSFPSPGGWQIIGRTPLKLFHLTEKSPAKLDPGVQVQFYPITLDQWLAS